MGQKVRTLLDRVEMPGARSVDWDGCNQMGERVGSGVYFYRLKADGFTATRKLLLLRQ
jgi:hypothetical protein